MKTYGLIYSIDLTDRIIGIKRYKRVTYYYFQASLFHLIKRYLYVGNVIFFEHEKNSSRKKHLEAYLVTNVITLFKTPKYHYDFFYSKPKIDSTMKSFLNSIGNALFIDFEMTMPSYNSKGITFLAEIIQAGLVLVNENYSVILNDNYFIKPVINPELNPRTLKFLNYDKNDFYEKAVSYETFYYALKDILITYNPTIIVYGKNDILYLEKSFEINHLPSLKNMMRIVNLNKIIKTYYNLKNDPGLFKLLEIYDNNEIVQVHDALDDAIQTKEVYRHFKDDVFSGGKLARYVKNSFEMVKKTN